MDLYKPWWYIYKVILYHHRWVGRRNLQFKFLKYFFSAGQKEEEPVLVVGYMHKTNVRLFTFSNLEQLTFESDILSIE